MKTLKHSFYVLLATLTMFYSVHSWAYCSYCCDDMDMSCGNNCMPDCNFCLADYLTQMNYTNLNLWLEGTFGKTYGVSKSYGTLGLFIPLTVQNRLFTPYIDVRGHYFEENCYAFNVGGGFRYRDCCFDRIWGAFAYWDFRNACNINFNQVGVCFESLGRCFDIRFNGYFPTSIERKERSSCVFDNYTGNYYAVYCDWLGASRGCDLEVGSAFYRCCGFLVYPALGFYYYYPANRTNVWGFLGRFRLSWRELVALEYRYTNDKIFGSCSQGLISVSIPFSLFFDSCNFSCFNATWQDEQLFTPPVRQPIIALTRGCQWITNF